MRQEKDQEQQQQQEVVEDLVNDLLSTFSSFRPRRQCTSRSHHSGGKVHHATADTSEDASTSLALSQPAKPLEHVPEDQLQRARSHRHLAQLVHAPSHHHHHPHVAPHLQRSPSRRNVELTKAPSRRNLVEGPRSVHLKAVAHALIASADMIRGTRSSADLAVMKWEHHERLKIVENRAKCAASARQLSSPHMDPRIAADHAVAPQLAPQTTSKLIIRPCTDSLVRSKWSAALSLIRAKGFDLADSAGG
ncbi:hypothetical protein T484DRAFT_1805064 [Baffinella frigidus]|nr:hypothetical protein T484DRAFT_1805064 [Cryptophyta sp. CCMP2293]